MDSFRGKCVTVMGLGLHGGGASVALWLAKHSARVTVTDLKSRSQLRSSVQQLVSSSSEAKRSREARKKNFSTSSKNIVFIFGKHRAEDFINADMIVRNPAVPIESPFLKIAEKHDVPIENEATLFFKHCQSKNIIGVTGTRGKSTTAAMIATILKEQTSPQPSPKRRGGKDNPLLAGEGEVTIHVWFAGNIRTTPMLSIVDKIKPDDWVVLELSSWHLEDMDRQKISPHIAVVTNVLQDHLNRYTGMRPYARAKESIVRYQKKGDIAVLNKENAWTRAMAKKTKAKVVWFPSLHNSLQLPLTLRGRDRSVPPLKISHRRWRGPASLENNSGGEGGEGALWKIGGALGQHNIINAQAAATVAHAIGVSDAIIRSALKNFRGLPDRLELVRTVRGVQYYNDTTATTPDATIAALKTVSEYQSVKVSERRIILIAGGSDKKLDYAPLMPWIKKTCKAIVLLPGAATEKIKKLLVTNYELPVTEAMTMPSAVRIASRLAERGDIVLLSPAAASFGLFQHEFDRGEQFRKVVRQLEIRN